MGKPTIGIDLDGVICRPPFGLNVSIRSGPYRGRSDLSTATWSNPAHVNPLVRPLKMVWQVLKYAGRSPMADAKAGLSEIGLHRELVLITSRNGMVQKRVEAWLAGNGLLRFFKAVYTNHPDLPSPLFKRLMVSQLGIEEFIDDDGRVVDLLAREGLRRVYIRDWPRNRGCEYPSNVFRVNGLSEVARLLDSDPS